MSSTASSFNSPLSINQLLELIGKLPSDQKNKLLKFLQKELKQNDEIPESHKEIVRERIKKSKTSDLLDWEKIKDSFDGI